jgi:hypothetical protein
MKDNANLLDFAPGQDTGGVGLSEATDASALGGVGTDSLSDADLAAIAGEGGGAPMGPDAGMQVDPEEMEVEQLSQLLNDPNLDPATREELQQRLAIAARRRLAGMGGAGMGGPGALTQ